jgi:hypothetical protein
VGHSWRSPSKTVRMPVRRPRHPIGAKPPVNSDDGYVTMGGPDEATYYVTECGAAWHRTVAGRL